MTSSRNSHFPPRRLGAEKYQQWFSERVFASWDEEPAEVERKHVNNAAKVSLSHLSDSGFLLDNFWRLSHHHAGWFTDTQDETIPAVELEAFMMLLIRLQEERSERCLSYTFTRTDLKISIQRDIDVTLDSEARESLRVAFLGMLSLEGSGPRRTFLNSSLNVLLTLEDFAWMTRVLEVCYLSKTSSVSDTLALMREWDTVKDFPANWALEYVRSGGAGV